MSLTKWHLSNNWILCLQRFRLSMLIYCHDPEQVLLVFKQALNILVSILQERIACYSNNTISILHRKQT